MFCAYLCLSCYLFFLLLFLIIESSLYKIMRQRNKTTMTTSNTDYLKFININNNNINEFIQSIDLSVDKITIWNYDFNQNVSTTEKIKIPSLLQFRNLKHFHCYNINIQTLPELPDSITDITCVYCNLSAIHKLPPNLVTLRVQHNNITEVTCSLPSNLKIFYFNNNNFDIPISSMLLMIELKYMNNNINLQDILQLLHPNKYIDIKEMMKSVDSYNCEFNCLNDDNDLFPNFNVEVSTKSFPTLRKEKKRKTFYNWVMSLFACRLVSRNKMYEKIDISNITPVINSEEEQLLLELNKQKYLLSSLTTNGII